MLHNNPLVFYYALIYDLANSQEKKNKNKKFGDKSCIIIVRDFNKKKRQKETSKTPK